MRKLICSLLVAFSLAASAQTEPASVFITAGQSNADGRARINTLPAAIRENGYKHLLFANITEGPKAGFSERKILKEKRWAFSDMVNYLIDQNTNEQFYSVKCAYGGTAIALGQRPPKVPTWNASEEYLDTARAYRGHLSDRVTMAHGNSLAMELAEGFGTLVDNVLSKLPQGYKVKAILWHQGESDRRAAKDYYKNFTTLIAFLRHAIYEKTGDKDALHLPVILGTVPHKSKQYSPIVEEAQMRAVKDDKNMHLIDMSEAELLDDQLHFDSLATEYAGRAYYNKLVDIGAVKGKKVRTGKPYKK